MFGTPSLAHDPIWDTVVEKKLVSSTSDVCDHA